MFSPEDAQKITAGEEQVLITRAKQMGVPLHAVVTALADTWGYAGQNGNGAVRRAAPAQVMPSGSARLEQIQRGQAVQGLGRTQSGEAPAGANWQQMDNQEFKLFVGNMDEDVYLEMLRDPRLGKAFERRVSLIDMET